MENLFDDDILLNDDNDVTSAFGDTVVTSLSNLVNDNLNYLKFNSYINNDIYDRHNAYYELVFENVVFEFNSIKKLNKLLPSNIKIQISGDCKIHLSDDIIAKYKQVQQDMQISLFANTYSDFDDCDNITFSIFSILKDLRY